MKANVNKANGWKLFLFLLIYGGTMILVGFSMGEPWGYHEGVKDGVRSTLLINADNECEVLKVDRRNWN
ncbi:MAG: hypothetical protein CL666_04635 [Balneola sp.]|nr:hypothetical protein [Balneola sp.]